MKEISWNELKLNPMTMFGEEWFALAAGNEQDGANAMTIAWGHLGSLWERGSHANRLPTAVVYVRPSRYTKKLLDQEGLFTLSLFDADRKKALGYLGSHSGRYGDKFAVAGLTPVFEDGTIYCKEAKMVFVCRKLYQMPLKEEGFVDRELVDFNYPLRDFHEMYIGEIMKVLAREE